MPIYKYKNRRCLFAKHTNLRGVFAKAWTRDAKKNQLYFLFFFSLMTHKFLEKKTYLLLMFI